MITREAARAANAFSYSSAIVSCGSMPLASAWQRALILWYFFVELWDPRTLTALERASCWQMACHLLTSSLDSVDAVSFSVCATACAKSSWQLALSYLLWAQQLQLRQDLWEGAQAMETNQSRG
eukprot:Skav236689  [mRNA]  locus=scaffold847:162117:162611:- [translate_table: standard]